MRIDHLDILNFKAFRHCEITFDPQFNLIVGDNATGKTSLLDALAITVDSWFLGMRTAEKAAGIDTSHVHLATHVRGDTATFEKQFPSRLEARGVVLEKTVTWARELTRERGKTTTVEAKEVASLAERADAEVRDGQDITLPLICSYGTERLWFESRHHNKQIRKGDITPKRPSRFDGYRDCTAFEIQETVLLEWMKAQFVTSQQLERSTNAWALVKRAIRGCVENAVEVYFDARYNEFVVRQELLGDQLFGNLSDGQRIMLTLIGDLVRRVVSLNPHLGDRALSETPGIVLIDELDLHLHPKWQRRVIGDLKKTFPKVQFVATTHSPQLIGEAFPAEIHILEGGKVTKPMRSFGVDSSSILDEVMHAPARNSETNDLLKRFAELIDSEQLDMARKVLAQVEDRLGANDPDVTGATTMLHLLSTPR